LAARFPGWPVGQTVGQDPLLVQIYAAHFRHGDLFPVWSSSDAFGMGSPTPLYYQKAFFMVGGAMFLLLGGALKAALLVTLAIFMVVGAYGMRRALSVLTTARSLQVVGSLGFLFANWSFGEWLVRGDLAEFSALMVVPWLLWWCLTLVKHHRVSWSIIPTMVVLVDAHNAVALVSVIALCAAAITFVATSGIGAVRTIYVRLLVAVGAVTLILAPMVFAELKMSGAYNPATKVTAFGATVNRNFADALSYLYQPSFHWLSRTSGRLVPVQLDFAVSFLLVAGLVTGGIHLARRALGHLRARPSSVEWPPVMFLLLSFLLYLFLQFRISLPVYDVISPLRVITFPYRMMTFITPLSLLLAAVVADRYLKSATRRWPGMSNRITPVVSVLWLAGVVLLSPLTAHNPPPAPTFFPDTPFLPVSQLTPPALVNRAAPTGILAEYYPLFNEYLPKVTGANGTLLITDEPLYDELHKRQPNGGSLSSVRCSVTQESGKSFEALQMTFVVVCRAPTLVALPVSYNAYTGVLVRGRHGLQPMAVVHMATDPRIVVAIRDSRPRTIVVHLPTLFGILF